MASFTTKNNNDFKTTTVLYTIEKVDNVDVNNNGYNAFKIKVGKTSVVLLSDFLRCFPLRGYGEDLIFAFKAPDNSWVEIKDPTTPLPIQQNGTINALVKSID